MSDKTCETCEHLRDSSSEYCGGCYEGECWREAGHIKDDTIAGLTAERDALAERLRRAEEALEQIAPWLSAALSEPHCQEFKAAVDRVLALAAPAAPLSAPAPVSQAPTCKQEGTA